MGSLINCIIAEVKQSFDLVLFNTADAMSNFKISQLFGIPIKARNISILNSTHWIPLQPGCVKINCDGSSYGSTPSGSIGFLFRNNTSGFLGALVQNIGLASPLEAEFSSCMLAIEKALELHLTNIWIETDSSLVVKAYQTNKGVPWQFLNRWRNCMTFLKQIQCKFTHVHRSANLVADLAKNGQGLASNTFQWWDASPSFVLHLLYRDSLSSVYT